MLRLIFFALVAIILVIVVAAAMSIMQPDQDTRQKGTQDAMPDQLRTAAFIALLVVMFGVTSGAIGGL